MRNSSRYAIYYAPEVGSDLHEFGASWLGWDSERGQSVAHPAYPNLPLPVSELTDTPRKYGFHGTLKPPFHLSRGYTVSDLNDAIVDLAATLPTFDLERIALRSLGGFLAITPDVKSTTLSNLAASCVRKLDGFRATPSEAELTRRRMGNLSESQEQNLMRWGYPYVLEEFRFHLTLTGKLTASVAQTVQSRIAHELAETLSKPLPVNEICLFREEVDGRFHVVKRYALSAPAATRPEISQLQQPMAHHFG